MININYLLIIIIVFLVFNIYNKNSYESFNTNTLQNIYNQPLENCGDNTMKNGSWDNQGKCSEMGGGVHQICIRNISKNTPNFSASTGQSNWSDKRGGDNHCVCLGAWSLFNAKNKQTNNKVLKCEAIPKASLTKRYVSKFGEGWNKWNGLELSEQIKDGVEGLINNCYDFNIDINPNNYSQNEINKNNALKNNYCTFAKEIPSLNNTDLYKSLC